TLGPCEHCRVRFYPQSDLSPNPFERHERRLSFGFAGGATSQRVYCLDAVGKKPTSAVSKLYIAPAILTVPLVSSAPMTALRLWISAIVSSTFFRATASTKA